MIAGVSGLWSLGIVALRGGRTTTTSEQGDNAVSSVVVAAALADATR